VLILKRNRLLEISAVNVPANPEAAAKVHTDLRKSLEVIREKYGRVLSAKNRESIEDAIKALESLLAADDESDEDKALSNKKTEPPSADNARVPKKVETPLRKGGKVTKKHSRKILNRAIRCLVEARRG